MVMSHHKNERQNDDLMIAVKSFKNVAKLYLGITVTTHMNGLHLGNACYHSV
jgi:hypothetical protein